MGGWISKTALSLWPWITRLSAPVRETPAVASIGHSISTAEARAAHAEASEANARAEAARAEAQAARDARDSAEAAANAARAETAAAEARNRAAEAQLKAELDAAKLDSDANRLGRIAAEEYLKQGIRPIVWPTLEEFEKIKARYSYSPAKIHIAIAGWTGVGKSSLINAFRGVNPGASNAAAISVIEGTREVTRYPDPKQPKLVWFDVPGAGTLSCRDWTYFNDQGLYIFDSVLVVFSDRFTESDIAILRNCERYRIPAYIVRTKADQHTENLVKRWEAEDEDKENESEDEDEDEDPMARAKAVLEKETRNYVTEELDKAKLPPHEVFIVSQYALKHKVAPPRKASKYSTFDEDKLLALLTEDTLRRRFLTKDSTWWSAIGGHITRVGRSLALTVR